MTNAERQLTILLALKADTSGADKVRAEITALSADQAKLVAQINAPSQENVQILQQQAAQQAAINLQMERRVIMETQLEAAQAKLAGNTALAANLEREAQIRTQALTIQRALNVTTEESIALAERLVLAHEASVAPTALAGVNLNKAKGEAIVLAREMATGSVNARTLGALLGSLGTTLTIAGLAGYELFQVVQHLGDEARQLVTEYSKQTAELDKQVGEWTELAKAAGDFGDVIKLAAKVGPELASAKLAEFRAKELGLFEKFFDLLAIGWNSSFSFSFKNGLSLSVAEGPFAKALKDAQAAQRDLAKQQFRDASLAIDEAERFAAERVRVQALDPSEAITIYTDKVRQLKTELEAIDRHKSPEDLEKWRKKAAEVELYDKWLKEATKEQEKSDKEDATARKRAAQDALNASLREEAMTLEGIRQQQQLIAQNPFLSANEKQSQLANLYLKEQIIILAQIAKLKAEIAQIEAIGAPDQQAKVAQLNQKLQQLVFTSQQIGLKLAAITHPLKAELTEWVNSFGTSAHQIAQIIEGTINTALEGTNQLILDAAFRTGDWRQTIIGVERQIANMFLTWIEKQAMQFIAGETQKATATATQVAQAEARAAAEAPAAAAASISSYGVAALIGAALAIAAIAAIEGGFEGGGYTGGRRGKRAGIVHGEEFVFSAPATDAIGKENLARLHHFASGGRALGGIETDPDLVGPRVISQPQGGSLDWGSPNTGATFGVTSGGFPTVEINPGNSNWSYPQPTVQINPSGGSGSPSIEIGAGSFGGFGPGTLTLDSSGGVVSGGHAGPQGSIFGIDPRTGAFVYNAGAVGFGPASNLGGGLLSQLALQAWSKTMGFASGARVPGSPSMTDNMLAMIASGEVIISTPRVQAIDRQYPGLLDSMIDGRFAQGGRAGGSSSSATAAPNDKIEVHVHYDRVAAFRAMAQSAAGRKILRELKL